MDHNTGLQVRRNYPFGLDRNCGGINKRTCGIRGIEPRPGPGEALYEGQRPYRGLRRRAGEQESRENAYRHISSGLES
jgi:hypothetical protein